MKLRRIRPMVLPSVASATVTGTPPRLEWVEPTELYIDETYQRDLTRKSILLIKQMVASFAWNRMKPPICVLDAGKFHVVDGQHTAIAAATVGVKKIPIFVVTAETLDERARAFVGHNSDRIVVSEINIYHALLASGDLDALEVEGVCKASGVRIRELNQTSMVAEGDTKAVGLIRRMIKKHGPGKSGKVLRCLVRSRVAPISGAAILAAQAIVCAEPPLLTVSDLEAAMRIEGADGLAKARATAAKQRTAVWHELKARWIRRVERSTAA